MLCRFLAFFILAVGFRSFTSGFQVKEKSFLPILKSGRQPYLEDGRRPGLLLSGGQQWLGQLEAPSNPLVALWKAYNQQLQTRGQITRMYSSGVISGLGDFLGQLLSFTKTGAKLSTFQLDTCRLLIFMFMGTFYFGTVVHPWFCALEELGSKVFPKPTDKTQKSLLMITVDQTVGSTVVNSGFIFAFSILTATVSGSWSGKASLTSAWNSVVKGIFPVLLANWKIWPFVNFLNFFYVPLQFRLLVASLAGVLWNVLLSTLLNA